MIRVLVRVRAIAQEATGDLVAIERVLSLQVCPRKGETFAFLPGCMEEVWRVIHAADGSITVETLGHAFTELQLRQAIKQGWLPRERE